MTYICDIPFIMHLFICFHYDVVVQFKCLLYNISNNKVSNTNNIINSNIIKDINDTSTIDVKMTLTIVLTIT